MNFYTSCTNGNRNEYSTMYLLSGSHVVKVHYILNEILLSFEDKNFDQKQILNTTCKKTVT